MINGAAGLRCVCLLVTSVTRHGASFQLVGERLCVLLFQHHHGGLPVAGGEAVFELARVLVEVAAGGEALRAEVRHLGLEADVAVAEVGREVPVAGRQEIEPLALAPYQEVHGDALHAAGGELGGDLFPQQRAHRVADEPVEDAARLLGVDEARVELARVVYGALDGLLRDLVEDHAAHRHLGLEHLQQVPADGLALAVLIRREQELVGVFERVLEHLDHLPLVGRHDVERLVALGDVHAEPAPLLLFELRRDLGGRARQVAHVAHAGLHLVLVGGQEAADGAGFGGGFDDDEALHAGGVKTDAFRRGDGVGRARVTREGVPGVPSA